MKDVAHRQAFIKNTEMEMKLKMFKQSKEGNRKYSLCMYREKHIPQEEASIS